MKAIDIFHETWSALSSNKARSGLTMLGIVIGISSVIALVAIGQGAQSSVQASIQSIGSNLIIVMPGAQRGPGFQVSAGRGSARSLTMDDVTAIRESVGSVNAVSPTVTSRSQVTTKGHNTNTSIIGVTAAYASVRNVTVDLGDFITDQNVTALSRVAVIGPTVRDDLFGPDLVDPTGQTIRIKNNEFKVIGMTKSKGGTGFNNQDDTIYVPLTTAQRFLTGDSDYVGEIDLQASSAEAMTAVQQEVTDLLLERHKIDDPTLADFSVLNQADLTAAATGIAKTFTSLLAAVAGISLVVGGIGIMNMMLTTVTERTREIGLRKAIGAKRRDISLQFLAESVALTFVGGAIGVALGTLVSVVISSLGILQATVSLGSVFLAFGVAAAIGVVFGWYPARRAAGLNPIEALRYE